MKRFIILSLCLLFSVFSQAQQNIYEQAQIKKAYPWTLLEAGNSYYLVREVKGTVHNPILQLLPNELYLEKYNKTSHSLQMSVRLTGDTSQSNSVVTDYWSLDFFNNKLYALYTKATVLNGVIDTLHYFKLFDTALNTVTNETYLPSIQGGIFAWGGSTIRDDGVAIIGYFTARMPGVGFTSKYLLLDTTGQELGNDTVGVRPTGGNSWYPILRQIRRIESNKYLVTGSKVSGDYEVGASFGWNIVDSNMDIIDTFTYKKGLIQTNEPFTFTSILPGMVGLQTGSIISANTRPVLGGDSYSAYPIICKHTPQTRFGIDDYIAFQPLEPKDTAHSAAFSMTPLIYNPSDNSIYYATTTHRTALGLSCTDNSWKSYLEVICIDTSLNLKWRKLFKNEGECSAVYTLSCPDGRGGIIVTGESALSDNSIKQWAYYINDQTPSDNPTDVAYVAIKKDDGFVLYPIPAENEVHLIALGKDFREAALYDLSGRLLLSQPIVAGRTVINIAPLPSGIYIVKAADKRGNTYQKKMIKR